MRLSGRQEVERIPLVGGLGRCLVLGAVLSAKELEHGAWCEARENDGGAKGAKGRRGRNGTAAERQGKATRRAGGRRRKELKQRGCAAHTLGPYST